MISWFGKAIAVVSSYSNRRFGEKDYFWVKFWKFNTHERYKVFVWRAISGVLPTRDKINSIFPSLDGGCYFCESTTESALHILGQGDLDRIQVGNSNV